MNNKTMKKKTIFIFSLLFSSLVLASQNPETQNTNEENETISSYWNGLMGSLEGLVGSAKAAMDAFNGDEMLSSVEKGIQAAQEAGEPLANDAQKLWDQAKEKGIDFLEQGKEKAQDFLNQMPDIYQENPEEEELDKTPNFNQQA